MLEAAKSKEASFFFQAIVIFFSVKLTQGPKNAAQN
jgi:hypothetical protein